MPEPSDVSVLIIDDNETTRAVLRMIIQGNAYHVIGEANNGISGLARARSLHPDIVCLDIEMPGCNGFDVLVEIKKTLPNTAVLMVSGNNDRATIVTAIQLGASGFILKPFNSGILLDTLDKTAALLKQHLKK